MQSEGKQVMEDLNKQLESMHSMFEKISGGSYELKEGEGAQASEAGGRMYELEKQLQDTRKERDKLKRQLAEMEDQALQLR
jgi:predicted RNase H-like nuclease (RuvC/YqgF family)